MKLFEIFNEIKDNLNFNVYLLDNNDLKNFDTKKNKDFLIISTNQNLHIENCLIFNELPEKLTKLLDRINISFLKNKFNNQSDTKIGRYILDLNSRKIRLNKIDLDLTEKECDLILFIQKNKKVNLKEIQKNVWHYSADLETHTVETHIYRLRKKMLKSFKDDNFIRYDKKGYYIN